MRVFRISKEVSMKSSSLSDVSHILVCGGKSCKKDAKGLRKALEKAVEGTCGAILVLKTPCLGCCAEGPMVVVWPKGVSFQEAAVSDMAEIIAATGWVIPQDSGPDRGRPSPKEARTAETAKGKKIPAKAKKAH
jgi:(2Fe-2S) ferredoxin